MLNANQLDLSTAQEYRKKATVLAFRQETGATYDKLGSWGSNQEFPGSHFTVVGTIEHSLDYTGGRLVGTTDVYGCAEDEFKMMYEPSDHPGEYRKTQTVRAIQVDEPFTIDVITRDGNVEVLGARGEPGDWVVLQPFGERQLIKAAVFDEIYEPVQELA